MQFLSLDLQDFQEWESRVLPLPLLWPGFLNQYFFNFSERSFFENDDLKEHINDDDVRALIQQFMYGIVS